MSETKPQKLIIIGNGMAPGRMLENLLRDRPRRLSTVTIFNAEPRVNYDRIMLSPVLSGEKTYEEIVIHNDDWYAAHGIDPAQGREGQPYRPRAQRPSPAKTASPPLTTSW